MIVHICSSTRTTVLLCADDCCCHQRCCCCCCCCCSAYVVCFAYSRLPKGPLGSNIYPVAPRHVRTCEGNGAVAVGLISCCITSDLGARTAECNFSSLSNKKQCASFVCTHYSMYTCPPCPHTTTPMHVEESRTSCQGHTEPCCQRHWQW